MVKATKRIAAGAGAVALAAGAMLAMAPQAYAGEIDADVKCTLPMGQGTGEGKQKIKVDVAQTSAAAGAEVDVTVTLGPSPAKSPLAMSDVKATPSIDFKVGSATVTVTGPTSTIAFEAQKPIQTPPYTGKFKIPAGATGTIDLIPVKMMTKATTAATGPTVLETPCTITGATKVASITISGGGTTGTTGSGTTTGTTGSGTTTGTTGSGTTTGTTSSGTTTGGGTSSSSSTGSLPKTGPLDDAVSMGLVGGTVGLLGIGAVLIATRKVRASRNNTA